MTREIYTPEVGEILNVSEVTNMYKINLTDALMSSLSFSKLGEYELAYLVGQVQVPSGSNAPVLGMPSVEAEGEMKQLTAQAASSADKQLAIQQGQDQAAGTAMVVAGDHSTATQHQQHQLALQIQEQQLELLAREHKPVFVGDLKLTEFKERLWREGEIHADLMGDGVLVCNQVVALRKSEKTGQILMEGSPMSPDYYKVRKLLYKQFAIL